MKEAKPIPCLICLLLLQVLWFFATGCSEPDKTPPPAPEAARPAETPPPVEVEPAIAPAELEGLIARLADEDEDEQAAAVYALGQLGASAGPAADSLTDLLSSKTSVAHPETGRQIVLGDLTVEALGRIGAPALPALFRHIARFDLGVQSELRRSGLAVGAIGEEAVQPSIEFLELIAQAPGQSDHVKFSSMRFAMESIGAPAVPALCDRLMSSEHAAVRQFAVDALFRIRDDRAIPCLIRALSDEDRLVRGATAGRFGHFEDPRIGPALLAYAFGDDPAAPRRGAIQSLGRTGDRSAAPELLRLLDDPDVRSATVEALGRLGYEPAVEPLLAYIHDDALFLRRKVYIARHNTTSRCR